MKAGAVLKPPLQSLGLIMPKIAREGYPFIIFFLALTIAMSFIWIWAVPPAFVLMLFMVFFFRDPERVIPEREDIFVSPADGKVITIERVREEIYLKRDALVVSIFMSPFNVHVNRSPCDGMVRSVVYSKGRFLSAYKQEAYLRNENVVILLETDHGDIIVRQVAGFLARRVVCRAKEGDFLKKGERFGIIKFSSRVDLYLPLNTTLYVKIGDKVRAGETIVGEIKKGG